MNKDTIPEILLLTDCSYAVYFTSNFSLLYNAPIYVCGQLTYNPTPPQWAINISDNTPGVSTIVIHSANTAKIEFNPQFNNHKNIIADLITELKDHTSSSNIITKYFNQDEKINQEAKPRETRMGE